jgi:hypothetical protein
MSTHQRIPFRARRALAVTTIAALALGLGACGDDDSNDAAKADDTSTEATPTASGIDDYCAASVAFEAVATETGGPEADPVESAQTLLDAIQPVREAAPDEVAPDIDTAIEVMQSVVDTGDPSPLDSFDPAPIHAYDLQHCDWETTDVTAADYAFSGLPSELAAGVHSFELHNDGAEPHVMLVLQKAPGVTDSFDDILAGDLENDGKAMAVSAAFAPPGADGYGVADLEPGDYLVICPIPLGTGMDHEGDGPPHFMSGMRQELTVT